MLQPVVQQHARDAGIDLFSRILQATFAAPLLLFAGWIVWDYPVARPWLALLLLAVAAAQWLRPTAWLFLLPALLPVLELPPWSGRLLLDEYDAVLAMLAAAALLHGDFAGGGRQLLRRSYLPLWLLGLATLVALLRGLLPLAPLDANAWAGYLTPWNALRVGKGVLWALLFAPLLAAQLRHRRQWVEQDFTLGMVLAGLLFGIAVLWERGFFLDLFTAHSVWDLVDTWLDLAARYRITGLFSQMHLGGTAVDGFIVLVWPFALLLMLKARDHVLFALAALALGLIAYACLVTFTRTTYLAVAVAAVIAMMPLLSSAGRRQMPVLAMALAFALVMAAGGLIGFRYGGSMMLLVLGAALAGAGLLGYAGPRLPERVGPIGTVLVIFALAVLAIQAVVGSKYSHTGLGEAVLVSVPLVGLVGGGGWFLGRSVRHLPVRVVGVSGFALLLLLIAVPLGLGGTQMQARLANVSEDFAGRMAHWRYVIGTAEPGVVPMLFGQGMGRYPARYLTGPRGAVEGTYAWGDGTLRITGSKYLHISQRLGGWSPAPVRAHFRYRVLSGSPELQVQLARRPLLVQEWFRAQVNAKVRLNKHGGDWQEASVRLDGSKLPSPHWYQPSFTLFSLRNAGKTGSVVEFDSVRLIDAAGHDLLHNPGFQAGGDRWFAYNDYDHLAWHAKNLALIIWFDQGLLGLLAVVVFLVPAFIRLTRRTLRGERFPLALLAALSGFLLLGLTSTLFDVPRLVLLFWLMATMALYRRRYRPGTGPLPTTSGRDDTTTADVGVIHTSASPRIAAEVAVRSQQVHPRGHRTRR